jgi:hypothetical protein
MPPAKACRCSTRRFIPLLFPAICARSTLSPPASAGLSIWEPYPKSYARELHEDSIQVEGVGAAGGVEFVPFIGISPYRYRDLFEKGRRKYGGVAQTWNRGEKRPMIEVYYPTYFAAEVHVVKLIQSKLNRLRNVGEQRSELLGPV